MHFILGNILYCGFTPSGLSCNQMVRGTLCQNYCWQSVKQPQNMEHIVLCIQHSLQRILSVLVNPSQSTFLHGPFCNKYDPSI